MYTYLQTDKLSRFFITSEDERTTYKDKLNYVEQELAATKGRESALQERLLKELDGYNERYRDQVKKRGELEV
jgi:mitotic spindle assembly checkpoint protein MAD1